MCTRGTVQIKIPTHQRKPNTRHNFQRMWQGDTSDDSPPHSLTARKRISNLEWVYHPTTLELFLAWYGMAWYGMAWYGKQDMCGQGKFCIRSGFEKLASTTFETSDRTQRNLLNTYTEKITELTEWGNGRWVSRRETRLPDLNHTHSYTNII